MMLFLIGVIGGAIAYLLLSVILRSRRQRERAEFHRAAETFFRLLDQQLFADPVHWAFDRNAFAAVTAFQDTLRWYCIQSGIGDPRPVRPLSPQMLYAEEHPTRITIGRPPWEWYRG